MVDQRAVRADPAPRCIASHRPVDHRGPRPKRPRPNRRHLAAATIWQLDQPPGDTMTWPPYMSMTGAPWEGPLRRERMSVSDLEESARAPGIADLADVRAAVLETDGKISFITSESQNEGPDERRAS